MLVYLLSNFIKSYVTLRKALQPRPEFCSQNLLCNLHLQSTHKIYCRQLYNMLNTMLNGLSLAILTHTFVFKSTPGAGSLEPFGCYFGIQCSVKLITNKISDRVGCLCAILVLFVSLFIGMCQSSHQRKFCNSNTIGCSHHSGNLSI